MNTSFYQMEKIAPPFSTDNSELRFRSLVENINDVLFALTPAGIFSYVSLQWKVAFGYEPDETVGRSFIPFVHPEDVPGCLAFLQLVVATGERQSGVEYRVRCKDGTYLWYRANASLVKDPVTSTATVVGIARDITEQKQLEEFLEENREKFRCLSEAAYEAIFISEKGLCLEQNTRAEELFGYTTSEAIGRPGTDWIVPEDRDLVMKNMMDGYEMPYEVTGLRRDGSTFPALIRGRMMQLKGRTVRVTSMTDITDRIELHKYRDHLEELVKERTAELETVNEALAREIQQSQRAREDIESLNRDLQHRSEALELANRELESFSYSVSHDLQAPLRHIAGFSRILIEEHGDSLDADATIYVKRIGTAVDKMGLLIDSLLGLASISRTGIMLQKIDLSRMATEIAAELRETAPRRNVRIEITAGLTTIADSNLIRAMLQNLLGNAWKYTREVSAAEISFSSLRKGGQAVYCIRDNGAGFDMAYATKLFGAFQRMHGPEYEGTGIGLASAQRIIQRHGGTIWFEAEPGKGASFYFTLNSR